MGTVPNSNKFIKFYARTKWVSYKEKEKKEWAEEKKLKPEDIEKGILKFNILRAKKLLPLDGDDADPLCKITFKGIEKIEDKTKEVSNTVSPQFDAHF